MKFIVLLFISLILGFITSVYLTIEHKIDIPPFITGMFYSAIGYFIFRNSLKEDEN